MCVLLCCVSCLVPTFAFHVLFVTCTHKQTHKPIAHTLPFPSLSLCLSFYVSVYLFLCCIRAPTLWHIFVAAAVVAVAVAFAALSHLGEYNTRAKICQVYCFIAGGALLLLWCLPMFQTLPSLSISVRLALFSLHLLFLPYSPYIHSHWVSSTITNNNELAFCLRIFKCVFF